MADFNSWATSALAPLLPLDDDSLKQIVEYSVSLPAAESAEHLKNLLGDSPLALEFISTFNARRRTAGTAAAPRVGPASSSRGTDASSSSASEAPRGKSRKKRGGAAPFNQLPPVRRVEDRGGNVAGGYVKRDQADYMAPSGRPSAGRSTGALADTPALKETSSGPSTRDASPAPAPTKLPPSAAGPLISDAIGRSGSPRPGASKSKARSGKPAAVSLTGGTPMRGASTLLDDLDSAIRALELHTNPTLAATAALPDAARRCPCQARRHPLLAAAPNCLRCGKIVCVKEGLGPCTACGNPLLPPAELHAMLRALREERGRARMDANNAARQRAGVAKGSSAPQRGRVVGAGVVGMGPTPADSAAAAAAASARHVPPADDAYLLSDADEAPLSTAPAASAGDSALAAATAHRDNLLRFQAENARRTRVRDEAADFDFALTSGSARGTAWTDPAARARALRRQQGVLRALQDRARPAYERRKVVELEMGKGGKVVRRVRMVEEPVAGGGVESEESEEGEGLGEGEEPVKRDQAEPMRGDNPLRGTLVKPVAKVTGAPEKGKAREKESSGWRRVQDDWLGDSSD